MAFPLHRSNLFFLWLLASLLLAGGLYLLFRGYIQPHRMRINEEITLVPHSMEYYHDFNRDGYSERYRISSRANPERHLIFVSNYDSRVIDQANYSEAVTRQGLFFADLDGDKFDELFALTWARDSLFLYIHNLQSKNAILYRQHIPLQLPDSAKETGIFRFHPIMLKDVDEDRSPEFIFALFGSPYAATRSVYSWDFRQAKMTDTFRCYAAINEVLLFDLDNDGADEIILSTAAVGNVHQPAAFSDQHSWIFVLNQRLKPLFAPARFVPYPGKISTVPLIYQGQHSLVVFESYNGVEQRQNFMYQIDKTGQILRKQPSLLDLSVTTTPLVDLRHDPPAIIGYRQNGQLVKIDAGFREIKATAPSPEVLAPLIHVDLNGDGFREILCVSSRGSRIYNADLQLLARIGVVANYQNWSIRSNGYQARQEVLLWDEAGNKQIRCELLPARISSPAGLLALLVAGTGLLVYLVFTLLVSRQVQYRGWQAEIQQSDAGSCLISPQGTVLKSNPAFSGHLGFAGELQKGNNLLHLLEKRPSLLPIIADALESRQSTLRDIAPSGGEWRFQGKLAVHPWCILGRWPLYYHLSLQPFFSGAGEEGFARWTGFIAEQGHHVKNNITALRNFIEAIETNINKHRTEADTEILEDIHRLKRNMHFSIAAARSLVDFSRHQVPRNRQAALLPLLEELVRQFAGQYPAGPQVEFIPTTGSNTAFCDPDHLMLAIRELLQNAAKAGGSSGLIQIYTSYINSPANEVEFWEVEVRDNGPGIPVEDQDSIFDAGFSTSETGNGMGLAYAKLIAESCCGRIECDSRPGNTRFTIRLPSSLAAFSLLQDKRKDRYAT